VVACQHVKALVSNWRYQFPEPFNLSPADVIFAAQPRCYACLSIALVSLAWDEIAIIATAAPQTIRIGGNCGYVSFEQTLIASGMAYVEVSQMPQYKGVLAAWVV
jgi:hypothetical protein